MLGLISQVDSFLTRTLHRGLLRSLFYDVWLLVAFTVTPRKRAKRMKSSEQTVTVDDNSYKWDIHFFSETSLSRGTIFIHARDRWIGRGGKYCRDGKSLGFCLVVFCAIFGEKKFEFHFNMFDFIWVMKWNLNSIDVVSFLFLVFHSQC